MNRFNLRLSRLPDQGLRPVPAQVLPALAQPQQQHRQPVEHPQEQHWQGPLQSHHARAAQRATQHVAAAVRGAGVQRAARPGRRHTGPL